MICKDLLRRIRNDLPMPITIATLGRDGPPAKIVEGYFRFVCPRCTSHSRSPSALPYSTPRTFRDFWPKIQSATVRRKVG